MNFCSIRGLPFTKEKKMLKAGNYSFELTETLALIQR